MPLNSSPKVRSTELNRRSETSLAESAWLNDSSLVLRKTRSLPTQEVTQVVPRSQDEGGKVSVSSAASVTERKVLHAWKDIASYMGLGVRTVQRYEQDLGLPVRRFGVRSSVTAFTDELDTWMRTAGTHPIGRAEWEQAMRELEALRNEVGHLRKITDELSGKVDSNERSRNRKLENRSRPFSSAS